MAYVITQKCIGTRVTAYIAVCPCDCVGGPVPVMELRSVPVPERGQRFAGIQMFADPDNCIDRGACMDEGPAAAIYLDDDVPAEHRGHIACNARFFGRDRSRGS